MSVSDQCTTSMATHHDNEAMQCHWLTVHTHNQDQEESHQVESV
jgi:hypothetical protein